VKEELVGRILTKILSWNSQDVARERPDLLCLAAFKYDKYQPFFPGMRFFESLALWLSQFEEVEERVIAYEFVKEHLVYLSDDEMEHLVTMAYPDYITQVLIERVSRDIQIPKWCVAKVVKSKEFKISLRQSIFLGLSDGAHIGLFRRSNPTLSHEQILRTHEINKDRAKRMSDELRSDLTKILQHQPDEKTAKFRNVFLLDDFSASGISYLRKEGPVFKGKLASFYNVACKESGDAYHLFDHSMLSVCLVLYAATEESFQYLSRLGPCLFGDVPFEVRVVCLLPNSIKLDAKKDEKFIKMLRKYFDNSIMTESYRKGKHKKPHMGFNECSLPLILSHNTPNNSIPLLWFEPRIRRHRGLFPRVNRHSV